MINKQYFEIQELVEAIIDNRGKTVPTSENGIPLIATNCIKHSSIFPTFENIRYINQETYDNWFRAHLKPNDILFVNKGTPGRCCIVPNPVNFVAAQDMVGLRFKKHLNPYYMLAVLRSKEIQNTIENNHVGLVIAHFRKQELVKLKLPILEETIRNKIGDFYEIISKKIELNNRINAELEAMAKTLYDYWFVQFDFPNIEGKPYKTSGGKMVYNETLKREIPEGWEVKTVGNILDKNKATNKINAKEYLNMGKIPVIDQSTNFICGFTNDESSLITTKEKPAIVFGDHTRILKLINFDFARGADGTQILFSKIENMPQFLLYYSLLKIDLSNYGYARHFKFLKEQNLLIPKKEIAKEFNDLVKSYYVKIYNNLKQNQELSALRDWLLPMLMNGQVKVG